MNGEPFKGKSILFFCPKTFGYEEEILEELQTMGAEVTFHSDKFSESPLSKVIIRLFPKLGWIYGNKYFESWLNDYGPHHCDFVFIIKGEGLSPRFIKLIKWKYPKAIILLHLWDSLSNVKYTQMKLSFVDEFTSFDPMDCKKNYFIRYRPLFFSKNYSNLESCKQGHNIFFIGTLNGDRPRVIFSVLRSLKHHIEFNYWLFVRSRVELMARKILDRSLVKLDKSRFLYKSMSRERILWNLSRCSVVLDIEHPKQTGLTMRTFEVLASGKKLVTTNSNIIAHNFYDPARICIIDRRKPFIPYEFLVNELPPLSKKILDNYSLRGWILDIFKNHLVEK